MIPTLATGGQDLAHPAPVAQEQQSRQHQGDLIHWPRDGKEPKDQEPSDRTR